MRPWPSIDFDSLAQLVEHRPFKALVLGSNPRGVTSNMRGGACKTTRTILASFKKDPRSPTFFIKTG